MEIKINNSIEKNMKIDEQTIYDACRLLTLAQIENVLKSECEFVLLWIGEEINYIYCDPIPTDEMGKYSAEKTGGYYLTKKEFISKIQPRLVGIYHYTHDNRAITTG